MRLACCHLDISYRALWFLCRFFLQVILIDFIYKSACADLFTFLFFFLGLLTVGFLAIKKFSVLFVHTFRTGFFFHTKFLGSLNMSAFSTKIFVLVFRFFLEKFCHNIENDEEKDYQTKNDQSFCALCRSQDISHERNCNYNLLHPVLDRNCDIALCRRT